MSMCPPPPRALRVGCRLTSSPREHAKHAAEVDAAADCADDPLRDRAERGPQSEVHLAFWAMGGGQEVARPVFIQVV